MKKKTGLRPVVGRVILIEHSGKPTEWTVRQSGDDNTAHLHEIFETAKTMCAYELALGGTLKLIDKDNVQLDEQRGRAD
jgi:hypothetical protein